jgi:FAD/FMN-containing dehydrogenase
MTSSPRIGQTRLGEVTHTAGDEEYADTCTLFNSAVEKRPRYVVRCRDTRDVQEAIAFARDAGLELVVRGGGHSVSGASLCEDGVVLDVQGLNDVAVDPGARTVTVGGGATTAEADAALQAHGLATTLGRVSTTGVAGFTQGGGSGWAERTFGFAVDNLLAATVVTADGKVLSVDDHNEPDLFWALRGGGGNFGVVTSMTFRAHPQGLATSGLLLYPASQGATILRGVRDLMLDAPDHLSIAFAYLYGPEDPAVPESLRGQLMAASWIWYLGDPGRADEELRAVRSLGTPLGDWVEQGPYAERNGSMDDPPGYRNYFSSEHIGELTDAAIDTIHDHAHGLPEGPGWTFLVPWGGAVTRPTQPTPLANRDAAWVIHPGAVWEDPADDDTAAAWVRGYRDKLQRFTTGGVWLNFIGNEGQERIRAAFGPENYARLHEIKRRYDPDNTFHSNHTLTHT